MRPAAVGRCRFAWRALLRASLMIGLLAAQAHAGVVVTGPGLDPLSNWTSRSILPHADSKAAATSVARIGLEKPHPAANPPMDNAHYPSSQSAKWFGVCGAILLLLRRHHRC